MDVEVIIGLEVNYLITAWFTDCGLTEWQFDSLFDQSFQKSEARYIEAAPSVSIAREPAASDWDKKQSVPRVVRLVITEETQQPSKIFEPKKNFLRLR